MKRFITTVLIAFLIPLLCVAAPPEGTPETQPKPKHYDKRIFIQGGYDSVASIRVDPIPIQTEKFLMGMPFPIDDPSAQFGASDLGRQIAKWHVLTNDLFVMDIEAEILHNYSENNTANNAYETGLGYKLTFTYQLSYTSKGEVFYNNKSFSIDVPVSAVQKSHTFHGINILGDVVLEDNSLVGSADGFVFFSFDKPTSDKLAKDYESYPNGNYNAVVTIALRVKDKK